MVSITFTDGVTVIPAAWLNDVNDLVYDVFGGATTVATARTALGLGIADSPTFAGLTLTGPILALSGTAAAPSYSFASQTNIGMFKVGTDVLAFSAKGLEIFRMTGLTSAVNFWEITNQITGAGPVLAATGSDTNVSWNAQVKGSENFNFRTATGATLQFRISHVANAVNFWNLTGQSTGNGPTFTATGSDTNVEAWFVTKGTGAHRFYTNASIEQVRVIHAPSAVNYLQLHGNSTGNSPTVRSAGTDTNVGLQFLTQAAGAYNFYTDNGNALHFRISHTANSVNFLTISGGATGSGVTLGAGNSSDTNVDITFTTKGNGNHHFSTGGGEQFRVTHIASAVNYIRAQGAAATGQPALLTGGSDTNIGLNLASKGTGAVTIQTGEGSRTAGQFIDVASSVNFLQFIPNSTGNPAALRAGGSDTNIGLTYQAKGTSSHDFRTDIAGVNPLQFRVSHTASAVNFINVTGAAAGGTVFLGADGTDADVTLRLSSKGTDSIQLNTGGGTQAVIFHTASAVNFVQIGGSATGQVTHVGAAGSDTNVPISFFSKGSGNISFMTNANATQQFQITHTASAVNFFAVTGSTAGNPVLLQPVGSDSNIEGRLGSKGTASVKLITGAGARVAFEAQDTASSVNYMVVKPAATAGNPFLFCDGTDANIGIQYFAKGTGGHLFQTNGTGSPASQFSINHTASSSRHITVTGSNGGNPIITTTAGALQLGSASVDVVVPGSMMQQNSQSAAYTAVAADANKHLYHPTSDDNPRTFTIPANASVAYAIGTMITFVNDQNTMTISINSDTLVLAGTGATGSRTLAENGIATAVKVTSTRWIISGTGLT